MGSLSQGHTCAWQWRAIHQPLCKPNVKVSTKGKSKVQNVHPIAPKNYDKSNTTLHGFAFQNIYSAVAWLTISFVFPCHKFSPIEIKERGQIFLIVARVNKAYKTAFLLTLVQFCYLSFLNWSCEEELETWPKKGKKNPSFWCLGLPEGETAFKSALTFLPSAKDSCPPRVEFRTPFLVCKENRSQNGPKSRQCRWLCPQSLDVSLRTCPAEILTL